ncbi:MAG: PAS domain-containing protein [Planctomycetota bacterium]|nr:PAS domain-containing protein [Planctomycetota bacterium]
MFGCATREEFLGKHPSELSPPTQPDGTDSLTLAKQRIATAMEQRTNLFEWVHQRTDGTPFPAEVLLNSLEMSGKEVLQAVVRDISVRKHVEDSLRENKERFQRVATAATDLIYEWDVFSETFRIRMI